MKSKVLTIALFCSISIVFQSCGKDFLDDTKPEDKISDANVWSSPELAIKVIYGCYQALPEGHTMCMMMSSTDEAIFYGDASIGAAFTKGLVSPSNQGGFSASVWSWAQMSWQWDALYQNIRNINIGIANIGKTPFTNPEDKDRAVADLYFLRGYCHFLLMSQYGGIPYYDQVVNLGDDYNKPRNTFEETVNYIVTDLEKAINLYRADETGLVKTRADKGVAMAVKAKVLLYAASDLHNPAKNGELTSGYSNPELIGYTSGDASAKWQAAKDAAKAVIDLNAYSLYNSNPDKIRNFEEIFVKRSDEDIFIRYVDPINDLYWGLGRTPFLEAPPSFGGWGWSADNVLGDLVDAFEMSDGSKFDWSNPVQAANPYLNRDNRFYASVLFEGATWYDNRIIHVGVWPDSTYAPEHQSTNYWVRKFSDIDKGPMEYSELTKCPAWPRMRYSEVLLNYAEACIELGEYNEARTYINLIRDRAGMPAVTESGAALKERYRNERRVELAFEEQRFFDVRRWMIGPEAIGTGAGINVRYPVQGSYDNPTFEPIITDAGRLWVNKAYFIPITIDEMNKNTALIQNPGY
ncbi:MAG TPA: RagB/SusD family nutrient uptake outer membrane protein [Bacteroidales bacterium]|jgi:hypothetical protein|nr:RagB/SusD family nutrient uptake outer membrane protein [Bacteroidales bacterium]